MKLISKTLLILIYATITPAQAADLFEPANTSQITSYKISTDGQPNKIPYQKGSLGINDFQDIDDILKNFIIKSLNAKTLYKLINPFPNWPIDPLQAEVRDVSIWENKFTVDIIRNFVDLDGDPIQTEIQPIFMGANVFENDTDNNQTYNTSSFEKAVTNSSSTTTTNGWERGGSGTFTAKFDIPLVGGAEASTTIIATANGSTSEQTTNQVTQTYISPPQSTLVPPHSKAKVTVLLSQAQAKGKYNFFTQVTGNSSEFFNFYVNGQKVDQPGHAGYTISDIPFYDTLGWETDSRGGGTPLPIGISLQHTDRSVLFQGSGIYEAQAGLNYIVKTETINTVTQQLSVDVKVLKALPVDAFSTP